MTSLHAHLRLGKPTDARLRCLAQRLHRLGERPLFEFLLELDAGADIWPRLEAYAALAPSLEGDRLPAVQKCRLMAAYGDLARLLR
jgi:hypothetical protein